MFKALSKRYKRIIAGGVTLALIMAVVLATGTGSNITMTGLGFLSFNSNVALAANIPPPINNIQREEASISTETWGYRFVLDNGDIVEIGDSTTTDFKAHIKTIRWNGLADFSLWFEGGTFTPVLNGDIVSFVFNDVVSVKIYPSEPTEALPEGGIEYDITINSKPAQTTIDMKVAWNGMTFEKILPLDEEYTQAICEEEWGIELAPFLITPASITSSVTSDVLKTRPEYEINSYLGTATQNYHNTSLAGGDNVLYSTVSKSFIHIHRGLMTDAIGQTAWVEDININESKGDITFTLPRTWLRTQAVYPISQLVGVDPSYTEGMDNWDSSTYGSDATWSDYDLYTNHGVPKGAVAEVIISNQEAGYEAATGIRNDSTSHSRIFTLHEAESGGETYLRLFVTCHITTGLVETYSIDISDANLFYLVGYWENVTFKQEMTQLTTSTYGSWHEKTTTLLGTNKVHQIVLQTNTYAKTVGARNTSSSADRYVLLHESENGGYNYIDMLVKADENYTLDLYIEDSWAKAYNTGYFGGELDFVGYFWDTQFAANNVWAGIDCTSHMDEDGRVGDFLLLNGDNGDEKLIGIRNADDTTIRYLEEHEAEDDGSSTGELTGFGISAQSNNLGKVEGYTQFSTSDALIYFMGYFKPASTTDISNTPSSKAFSIVDPSSTYWSNGSEPTWVLVDGDAYFTVTNNSGAAVDISVSATNFTGGVGWTLTTGSPGSNTVRLTVFAEGDDSDEGIALTTSPQSFITSLADSGDIDWELKMETGTYTDGAAKTSTVTLTAALSSFLLLIIPIRRDNKDRWN